MTKLKIAAAILFLSATATLSYFIASGVKAHAFAEVGQSDASTIGAVTFAGLMIVSWVLVPLIGWGLWHLLARLLAKGAPTATHA